MGTFIDLKDKKFGRLRVIEKSNNKINKEIIWKCICDCGNIFESNGYNLKNGNTSSCGCLQIENTISRNYKHGMAKRGMLSPEFISYVSMIQRCYDINVKSYLNYGGRNIIVCDRWLGENGFINFLADMGYRPSIKHSLDRFPNNDTGIYEPNNCRWATLIQQAQNRRNNHWIEYNGIRMVVSDWEKKLGAARGAISHMVKNKSFDEVYKYYSAKAS